MGLSLGSYGIEELEFNLGLQGQNQKIEVIGQGSSKLRINCSEFFACLSSFIVRNDDFPQIN